MAIVFKFRNLLSSTISVTYTDGAMSERSNVSTQLMSESNVKMVSISLNKQMYDPRQKYISTQQEMTRTKIFVVKFSCIKLKLKRKTSKAKKMSVSGYLTDPSLKLRP
ncbi:Uncharacterised protein at_DN2576 [Pycnogonum litorale]